MFYVVFIAKNLVHNESANRMEMYYRDENQAMIYNTNNTLLDIEHRARSASPTLWATRNTMIVWNSQRYIYGAPIYVGVEFRRPWKNAHGIQTHKWMHTVEHIKI